MRLPCQRSIELTVQHSARATAEQELFAQQLQAPFPTGVLTYPPSRSRKPVWPDVHRPLDRAGSESTKSERVAVGEVWAGGLLSGLVWLFGFPPSPPPLCECW